MSISSHLIEMVLHPRQVFGATMLILQGLLLLFTQLCGAIGVAVVDAHSIITIGDSHRQHGGRVAQRLLQDDENITTTSGNGTKVSSSSSSSDCVIHSLSPVSGLRAELNMLQRQTRGVIQIINNCQFQVNNLEVALDPLYKNETSIELYWYGAESLEIGDVASKSRLPLEGITIFSSDMLTGNNTFVFDVVL